MTKRPYFTKIVFFETNMRIFFFLVLSLAAVNSTVCGQQVHGRPRPRKVPSPSTELNLKEIPFKIVYETYHQTNGRENWELFLMNADGSNPVNLTNTPALDEMYPHVSPDGTKVCFVVDELVGDNKVRNVYYMNIDGTGRVKVAENARDPCWSPDGKTIAYLKGEFDRYTITDYASKGLFFYDLETQKHREHPNKTLHHLYNICWSADGGWFFATVHGGMGFKHAILAFETSGTRVFDLTPYRVTGCRPDCSIDGKKVTWGASDCDLCAGNIDLTTSTPKVMDAHGVIKCQKGYETYHADFSPDGNYIAFSYGPEGDEVVGGKAPGWNICVSDLAGKWVQVTLDGNHNKEPDWVPIKTRTP
jgi:dipeptidyl aminopeptidase/acylaminoacyl peptidase